MNNNAQCLITGGAGFIGSHLADKLLANGSKVTVFDNLSSGKIDNINHNLKNPDFKFVKKNLSNVDDITGFSRRARGCLSPCGIFECICRRGRESTPYMSKISITL